MRQYGGVAGLCLHSLPPDVAFKEVVIVGNGPSGISTSHLLAGHWPYLADDSPWNQHPAMDQMFVTRLSMVDARKSLMMMDLVELADGLEGRSINPVPLLMDNLLYPCADIGMDLPPMIKWKFKPERQIEHVVLGRGRAGGAWHCFDARVLTLSPARWLRLAGGSATVASSSGAPLARARVADVASYYEAYVGEMGLQRFFRHNTFVTSIRPVRCFGHPTDCPGSNCPSRALWCVCGYDSNQHTTFRYLCSRVVLATGASDRPNTLKAAPATSGQSEEATAIYSLPALELEIDKLVAEAKGHLQDIPPVLVVGSGLSAADAVVAARSSGIRVAHAYRRSDHAPPLALLPQAVYPDYHAVYQMMRNGPAGTHPLYTAVPDHMLVQISVCADEPSLAASIKPKLVKLLNTKTNELLELKVSLCAVLIGSKPDLSFLPENYEDRYITLTLEGDTIKLMDNPFKFTMEKHCLGQSPELCVQYSITMGFNEDVSSNRKVAERSRCMLSRHSFLKTQWHNLKTMVGHGLQGYRRRPKENIIIAQNEISNVEVRRNSDMLRNCFCGTSEIQDPTEIQTCRCGVPETNAANAPNLLPHGHESPKHLKSNIKQPIANAKIEEENLDTDSSFESNHSNAYIDSSAVHNRTQTPDNLSDGLGLGVDILKPIDCRSNSIDIDKTTHEVRNAPKGLYALGPLTGDNFVRFIPGGALAIVANIWTEKKDDLDDET